MSGWLDFWNGDTPIYVNALHKAAHYHALAQDYCAFIKPTDQVLDIGCGEALAAKEVAQHCAMLFLSDGASNVEAQLRARYGASPNIRVLSTIDVSALPAAMLDVIIVHSVAQYIPKADMPALLSLWQGKLKGGGTLLLGDILPPNLSPITDAWALLKFGWRDGFFIAAFLGLVKTLFSDYRHIRAKLGLSQYTEDDMRAMLEATGFSVSRAKNPGHNPARMAFLCRKSV